MAKQASPPMKQQPRQILYKNLRCANCKQRTDDWYMLRDEIWQSIARAGERYLCLACVSKRLGRELIRSDFSDLPINRNIIAAYPDIKL